MKQLRLIGLSHHTAPVAVREKVAVSQDKIADHLSWLTRQFPDLGAILVSTCNRTEYYLSGSGASLENIDSGILFHNLSADQRQGVIYEKNNLAAVEHLFRVAAGIESQAIGETEILGQVKFALAAAQKACSLDSWLHYLGRETLITAKRIHTETALSRGSVSLSSLAVKAIELRCAGLEKLHTLVIGGGEVAEAALKSLCERGVKHITVLNRTLNRADVLARRYRGRPGTFARLGDELARTDAVLASTSSPTPVISAALLADAMGRRGDRPLVIIDLAVPRDVEPLGNDIPGLHISNLDDLSRIASENLFSRQSAITQAEAIITEQLHQVASRITAERDVKSA